MSVHKSTISNSQKKCTRQCARPWRPDSANGNAEAFLAGANMNMTQSFLTPEISGPGITKIHKSSKLLDFL